MFSELVKTGVADRAHALAYTEPAENTRQQMKRIEKAANDAAKAE